MRILLIAPQPFYQDRGTPIAVRLLAETLGVQGHDVHLLVFHEGENIVIPNVTIHRNKKLPGIGNIKPGLSIKKLVCDFFVFIKAVQLTRRYRFDLVHAVEEAVFMAVALKGIFKVPYIYDMDSSMSLQLIDKYPSLRGIQHLMEWLEKKAVQHSLGVIAVCGALEEIARRYAPDKLIARIEDITLLSTTCNCREVLRQELGITGTIIMYVGNLEKYQGIDLLLAGFHEAVGKNDKLSLVIIGGNASDIASYQQWTEEHGLQDKIFFCGQRPIHLLGWYLQQADILVSPRTQGNNTPMKIYSYLDSGVPLLATRLPTHTQVLDDATACLVYPEPHDMAAGIMTLAKDATLRTTLSMNAKNRVKEEYSLSAFQRKVSAFYAAISNRIFP